MSLPSRPASAPEPQRAESSDIHDNSPTTASNSSRLATPRERKRVVAATIIGTTVEWYDFFIYGAAAGLVFDKLFFEAAGNGIAPILSFLTVGISFVFRPLGAFIAGHIGDRYGRRVVLVMTLVTMGLATTLIGALPTYASIGIAAPIMLVILRVLQGISAGGEWGGAALLAVENAPTTRRGVFGAAPQIGVPLGLLLASGVMALMTTISGDDFDVWGWRIPFLLSIVLVGIGYLIRMRVHESPVFLELAERRRRTQVPIATLFRKHTPLVLVAALIFAGNNAAGYMTTGGYIQKYATDPDGPVGLHKGPVLVAVAGSAVTWLIFTVVAAAVSDRIGRRTTYLVGWVLLILGLLPLFPLVNTGNIGLLFVGLALLTIGLGFTYGPQAALYAELFPASIRFSGASISYAIGAILGGAFAPTIAAALVRATGTTASVTIYLIAMAVLALCATLLLRDRTGIPLDPGHEAEQEKSSLHGIR